MVVDGILLGYDLHVSGSGPNKAAKGSVGFCVRFSYYDVNGNIINLDKWTSIHFGSSKTVSPQQKKRELTELLNQYVGATIKIMVESKNNFYRTEYFVTGVSKRNAFVKQIDSILNG